jgi:hypothetical protein
MPTGCVPGNFVMLRPNFSFIFKKVCPLFGAESLTQIFARVLECSVFSHAKFSRANFKRFT